MILCIGTKADEAFAHTLAALRRVDAPHLVMDIVRLASSGTVRIPLRDVRQAEFDVDGQTIRLREFSAIWNRLPSISGQAPTPDLSRRCDGVYAALARILSQCPIPTLNPMQSDLANFSKVLHGSSLAKIGGFLTPRSCLTNNPDEAATFVSSCERGAIFKGASSTKTWATLYDPTKHESRLPLLRSCPVLFQERIEGPDVRVHVVGEQAFGEMVESSSLDYRGAHGNRYTSQDPPAEIRHGCEALVSRCGVPFLGVDFKIERRTGRWFFLEANTMPCYAGYDRRSGGAISSALVRWLTTPRGSSDRTKAPPDVPRAL